MKLTNDQVIKVAKLANLPITEEETIKYAYQLSKILDYVDLLNSIDTDQVEPTFNITNLGNVFRPDQVKESLSQEQALSNTDSEDKGLFITKGVFNGE